MNRPQAEPTEIATRLERVRGRIAEACIRARRAPETVRLIAVSKTWPVPRIAALLAAGCDLFGENKVQEALAKIPELPEARWHFIGHLQRNKARHVVGAFELIHGVDNESLARELDRRCRSAGVRQAVLIQTNLAGEESKSGVDEQALPRLIDCVATLDHLDLQGLMTIPPAVERAEQSRAWFARLLRLRDREAQRTGLPLGELSMGMTDDFEVAVEEGATLVRVGRAIFGSRR